MRRELDTLGKFAVLLAGPLIWAAHLTLVYAAVSLDVTIAGEAGPASRLFIGGVTLLCLAAVGSIGWAIRRGHRPRWETPQADLTALWCKTGQALCLLSFVAILFQALPAILVPAETVSHAVPR